jgi:hypothetical protein
MAEESAYHWTFRLVLVLALILVEYFLKVNIVKLET